MVHIGYLENIIALIQWDAESYLPSQNKEMEIFQRIQDVIRESQQERKGEKDYETNKIYEETSE